MISSFFRKWFSNASQRQDVVRTGGANGKRRQLRASFRPKLELMEDRVTPTVFVPTTFTDHPIPTLGDVDSNGVITAGPGNGFISLRSAVIASNANGVGADTIDLSGAAAGTYILGVTGDDNVALLGDLDINGSLTITGNGAATTIIQGATNASFADSIGDKIIGINQAGTFNTLTVSISALTIRYGKNTNTSGNFTETGGGVDVFLTGTGNNISFTSVTITGNANVNSYGGGVNVDSANGTNFAGTVTFTGCTISNNTSKQRGGGLNLFADSHNVIIDSTTITNNQTTGTDDADDGGGINIRHNGGTITIRNGSTISSNTSNDGGGVNVENSGSEIVTIQDSSIANNNARGNGGGLAVLDSVSSVTLERVTLTGNTANSDNIGGGDGGAIYRDLTSPLKVNHSRFAGNIAKTGGGGTGTTGIYNGASATGTVNANFNWWGADADPGAGGTDSVRADGGLIDFSPRLDLVLTASPTTISVGQTSALTADFTKDSDGSAVDPSDLTRLIGQAVTWGASIGNVINQETTIQSTGKATATYDATTLGNATVSAQVDNTPAATASITVTTQPPVVDLNGADGSGVDFGADFVEDISGAVNIADTDATITDADNTVLVNLTLVVSANPDGAAESLTVAGLNVPLNANASGTGTVGNTTFQVTYLTASRTFTITVSSGTGAIGDFETLLRGVTYNNTSNAPNITPRTVAVTANDGSSDSAVATSTISVTATNDAPVVTTTAAALDYTENDGAVAVDAGVSIIDDSATLLSVEVKITAGFVSTEDALSYVDPTGGKVDGAVTDAGQTLTLTAHSGQTPTVADFELAARAVKYTNSSEDPSTAPRTVTFTANDGSPPNNIGTATRNINVAKQNDPPTVTASAATGFTEAGNASAQDLSGTGFVFFDDVDAGDTVSISSSYNNDIGWSGGTLDAGLITQLTGVGTFFASATGAAAPGQTVWVYNADDVNLDFLASGEMITFSFTVTATDNNNATDTDIVSFIITGQNDAPTVSASGATGFTEDADASAQDLSETSQVDFGDVDENDTVSISSSYNNDIVWTGGTLGQTFIDQLTVGTFTASISNSQAPSSTGWDYTASGVDLDFLAKGETITFSFTVTATDNNNATDTDKVTFVITGTNDAPDISVGAGDSASKALTESDVPLATSGTLTATDLDVTNTVSVAVTDVFTTGSTVPPAAIPSKMVLQAMMSVDPGNVIDNANTTGTIHWSFNSGTEAFNFLAAGEILELFYVLTVTDSNSPAATDSLSVNIQITGTNDAPNITIGAGDSASEGLTETNGPLAKTGTLTVTDFDYSNTVSAAVTSVVTTGSTGPAAAFPSNAALQAMMTVDAGNVIDNTHTTGTITWSFASTPATFDFLAAGETLVLTYTLTATDSHTPTAATDTQTVTITITGTNDAPDITVGAGDSSSANLTETNSPLSSSGTLSVADLDVTNTVSAAVSSVSTAGSTGPAASFPSNAVLKAMMSVDAGNVIDNTQTTGTINWSFASTPEAFNFLPVGQTLVLTYTLTATDSNTPAAADTQTVTITITGTNDAPTLTTFAASIDFTNQSVEVELTFAELAAQGNEADVDGTVTAFVVQAVSTGTLKIGTSAAAATPFAVGTNDTIDATRQAYWRPAIGDKGPAVNAFTVVAKDNSGGLSSSAVQVSVNVNEVSAVFIDFGANGFWRWTNVGGYTLIHPADVETFSVGADGFVYIDFGVYGLWRWAEAAGFQQLHTVNPENVVAGPDGFAYIDFGNNGFWRWSQATGYFQIHAANPENVTISNDGFVYIDFGINGLYRWSQATHFILIHAANPENIQAGADNFLYIDFGVNGFYRWSSATSYQLIHPVNPEGFTTGVDGFVTIDFGANGLWRWSPATSFVQIHTANAEEVVAGNGFLFIDFGSAGLWRWSQATGYLQIHPVSPQRIRA